MKKVWFIGMIVGLMPFYAIGQDGTLDSTFGLNGTIIFPRLFTQQVEILPVLDGQERTIIISTAAQDSILVVNRYLPNGLPDPSFGIAGQIHFGDGSYGLPAGVWRPHNTILQEDGKLLIGVNIFPFENTDGHIAVLRLKENGIPDVGFGDKGLAVIESDDPIYINGMGLQPDGQIVISGNVYQHVGWGALDVVLLRLTSAGKIDSTMGIVVTDLTASGRDNDYGGPVTVQPDGKIVVAACNGSFWTGEGPIVMMRHLPDGTLDASFGTNGIFIDSIHTFSTVVSKAIVIDQDSKILVAGSDGHPFEGGPFLTLRRYTTKGQPDTSFAENGWYTSASNGLVGFLNDMTVQPDHKILTAGGWSAGTDRIGVMMRFQSNGQPDSTFGTQGNTFHQIEEQIPFGSRIYQYPEGKISLLGYTYTIPDGFGQVFLSRFNNGIHSSVTDDLREADLPITLSPNPSDNGALRLSYTLPVSAKISIGLFDAFGNVIAVFSDQEERLEGLQTEVVSLPKGLVPGMYIIQVRTQAGISGACRLIRL